MGADHCEQPIFEQEFSEFIRAALHKNIHINRRSGLGWPNTVYGISIAPPPPPLCDIVRSAFKKAALKIEVHNVIIGVQGQSPCPEALTF